MGGKFKSLPSHLQKYLRAMPLARREFFRLARRTRQPCRPAAPHSARSAAISVSGNTPILSWHLGITPETRDDHAADIASWLKVLKDAKRAIFTAASHAQKAADYLRADSNRRPCRAIAGGRSLRGAPSFPVSAALSRRGGAVRRE